ncbi:MAG: methyltransferase domain-containing protein [Nanoarchaeota archaeon]|nr:class I SAM-dependent methyltransferase [Nanoarchaeota archaeon]
MVGEQILKGGYEGYKFEVKYPILDIGGGDGCFLRTQGIKKALIVDFNPHENEYEYIKADITKGIPVKSKFGTIFLMEVLEHVKNPLYVLAKAYDLLKGDGYLYIAVPYDNHAGNPNHHHVCKWKLKELLDQVDKLGFNSKVMQTRRRFKNLAFFLPHCWIVLKLTKRLKNYNMPEVGLKK